MSETISSEALKAARGYETLFVPALFGVWTKNLIEAAKVQPGQTVLDVACGTGVLTRDVSAELGAAGSVTGLDPAPGMLAAAQEIAPDIAWVSGHAEDLPFPDHSFDVVLCQFGMMFFQDREKACAEMLRILKPGGALAVSVWNSTEHNPAYKALISLMESEVSEAAASAVSLPFSLGDPDIVTGVLNESGFVDVSVSTLSETARFPSTRTMVEAELRGWLPLFDIHLSDPEIARVLSASDPVLAAYAVSGEAVFATSAHVISARRA